MTEGIIRSIRFLVGEAKEPQNADITEAERISDLERSAEDAANELDRLLDASAAKDAEIARLREALSAACGYMRNAAIDLGTGAPKKTALATVEGGLKLAEATLKEPSHG